ncbi:hypothetical protein CMV_013951 [Castanea mollissima]|uniref:Uncharacterized protein n=1 Tax=Castanea mollissima TaxID=60419 RepID=A0A8J4QYS9_9ROSI|nr:hypothetical protein CMV_013951 [Castanea mollissima]
MIKKIEKAENQPIHLLDLLRSRLLDCTPPSHDANKKGHTDFNSFRNVQELRAVGIYLMSSISSCLRNISFTQTNWNLLACLGKIISFTKKELHLFGGTLRLPPITVDDSTGPKFFNLIAYEMCPDFDNDYVVTSYISFLDSLIDEAKDVKNIRRAGILHNLLGSDEEVAQFFNEIGTDLVPNPDIYGKVRSQIEVYYNKKRITWIAEFLHTRFSSPWTIGAFVAALFALILSFIQALLLIPNKSTFCTACPDITLIDPRSLSVHPMVMSFHLFTFLLSNSHVRLNNSVWTMYSILNLM